MLALFYGCGPPDTARGTAELFLSRYLALDRDAALELATGQAREVLRREIQAVEGMPPPGGRPTVGYRLLSQENGDRQAVLVYSIEVDGGGERRVELGVTRSDAGWRVSRLEFR